MERVRFIEHKGRGVFRTREQALDWLVQQKEPPRAVPEEYVEDDTPPASV